MFPSGADPILDPSVSTPSGFDPSVYYIHQSQWLVLGQVHDPSLANETQSWDFSQDS